MLAGISKTVKVLAAVCACISCMMTCMDARADVYSEAAVKAAYLYRFTAYIDWPATTPKFIIAVLGDDEVAENLNALLATRSIKNLQAEVRRIRKPTEMGDAQILYIGSAFKADLRKTIASINAHPVLIVTSQPDGLDAGSAINFVETDNRIRFEVSIAAVEHPGLRIAPELLSVAVRVASNRVRHETNCRVTKTPEQLATHCTDGGAP